MKYDHKSLIRTLLAAALALAFSGHVFSQEEEEQSRFADAQTTKVKAISQQLARRLEPARFCLAPEPEVEGGPVPEPNANCAIENLSRIRTDDLPGHEKAEIWNLFGYSHYLLEDQARAKDYYARIVNEPEANAPLVNRTLKTLAQLYLIDEQFAEALKYYQDWMALQAILSAPDYALLSTIFYNLDNVDKSLENIEIAIEMRESEGRIGQENWYSIQKSIYYQRNNFPKTVEILEKLIVNYPNVRYWREIGSMFGELEDSSRQMAAYHLAFLQDGLTSEGQYVGLAYMYIGADVPYKAAELLIDAIAEEQVEDTEKHLQLVGSSLYQAGELESALPWMERAASKSTSGETYGRLAGIYVDLERYEDAVRVSTEALRLGGMRRIDLVRLTKGNAEFNLKRFDDAIATFRTVRDQRSRRAAGDWIRYVEAEKKRDKQLRDSGIDLDRILARN